MKRIIIDFETRSKVDLKKVGAFKYASDLSTEILCACWKYAGEDEVFTWSPFISVTDLISDLFEELKNNELEISAHNAHFEWAVWNYCGVVKYNFPRIPFTQFTCTAARANALALPRDLETCAKVLGLPAQKDTVGRRVMLKMTKPREDGTWNELESDFDILIEYCRKDVIVQDTLDKKLPELSIAEEKIFQLDFNINRKGISLDMDSINKAISIANKHALTLNEELSDLTNGQVVSATQALRLKNYLIDQGLDIESVNKEDIGKALKDIECPRLRRILEIRRDLAMSSIKKLQAMRDMGMRDNRARGTLQFLGANRTGRWSAKGIQTQNLPRGSLYGDQVDKAFDALSSYENFYSKYPDVLSALSSCVRGMIIPSKGYKLMSGDFSAIEARMLFWLSGHEKGLESYRKGKDIYKEMASFIFKKSYEDIQKNERQLGKAAILGAGYSMGAKKFRETCEKPPYNIVLTEEESKLAIETYRDIHIPVKQFWYDVDNTAKKAIRNKNIVYKVGKISLVYRGDFLYIQLPSKRKLTYFKPFLRTVTKEWGEVEQITFWGVDQETKKWGLVDTYGGKLVENITQATSRDLMAFALSNVTDKGYQTIMLVHDEIVAETLNGSVEEFKAEMEKLPDWAKDFPCVAEVEEMKRYKK